jgi:hypothetical protein
LLSDGERRQGQGSQSKHKCKSCRQNAFEHPGFSRGVFC